VASPHAPATRRDVIGGLAALGAGALVPGNAAWARAPAAKHIRIDVHRHFLTPETVGSSYLVEPPFKRWSLQQTLDDMEQGGVTTAMLSLTPNLLAAQAQGGPIAARHYRRCNEYGAQLVAEHKGRFGLFAGIPLTDTDASLAEIDYALGTLKADGIGVFTSYGNQWLGNAAFDPVFAELDRRKAVVFTHPVVAPCCSRLIPEVGDSEIALGTDTSYAIASMVLTGASQRYPDIRAIFSHGGGTMPFLIRRFVTDAQTSPRLKKLLPGGFMPEFHRFYFDVAQIPARPPLLALKEVAPISHILFGTDFPFRSAAEHALGLKQSRVFSARELRAIDSNGALLMPRLRAA
jgi:predicted TIM-barrel fold metal-dependent hydrolase